MLRTFLPTITFNTEQGCKMKALFITKETQNHKKVQFFLDYLKTRLQKKYNVRAYESID